ncbi:hypothetical protein F5146DRAFT_1073899 [Armillaria mellea]|nr:hypothetical protein F5146DRAFT_1073899 [Armillaria mellea]
MIIVIRQNTFGPTSTVSAATEATDGASLGSSSSNGAAKSTLEWLFITLVCLLILSIISRRIMQLKARRVPVSHFFRSHQSMSPSRGFPVTAPGYTLPQLSEIPVAYHPAARARAGGIAQEDRGDKDVLPAYDKAGSPPKYVEIESTLIPRVDSERAQSVTINTGPTLGCETHRYPVVVSLPTFICSSLLSPPSMALMAVASEVTYERCTLQTLAGPKLKMIDSPETKWAEVKRVVGT